MLVSAALKSLSTLDLDAALAAVRSCGLMGIEVDAGSLGSPSERDFLTACGIPVTTLDATAWQPGDDDWSRRVIGAIDFATAAGASIVIVSAGDDRGDRILRARLLDRHRHAADMAASRGILLAWDTLPGLCGDARAMHMALQEINHPAIRLNFDTGRYLWENPSSSGEVGLQRVFGSLASVRLTNFTLGVAPAEFPPLNQGGDVDFSRTCQFLGGLGFRGPCTIGFRPAARQPPTAVQCEAWLRESVEHLRGCGWFE